MLLPFVSVVIVNYNGAHFLKDCLDGLSMQSYPVDRFETIVSDNGSTDGSLELLQTSYPWVKTIQNGRNLGFATGNNIGIGQSQGDYVILLNNDTMPAPQWLENLVRVAENNPQAGMITGRLQLFYDQLELIFESETVTPINAGRTLGIQMFDVDTGAVRGVVQYLDGFYWREVLESQYFRWTKGRAVLGVPVPHRSNGTMRLKLAAARANNSSVRVRISSRYELLAELDVCGASPTTYEITLPESTRNLAAPLVQNAGSVIFSSGAGRDRGTFVRDAEVFYEVDTNQYNCEEEVFAACGANMLIRKSMLDEIGWFDDDFFMYYEDTDLSWRARLGGWKVLYAPQAIVRHIHCGSSVEWSPFFVYHADRNRLAMLFKNGTPKQIMTAWFKYLGRTVKMMMDDLILVARRQASLKERLQNLAVRFRVLGTLLLWLPPLWRKRRKIQQQRRVSVDAIHAWFVG